MQKLKKNNKILQILLAFVLLLCLSLTGFCANGFVPLLADSSKYTDPLADLQIDESFSIDDYPKVDTDYTLSLITIAESKESELFLYVYQPSAELGLTATCINMSIDNQSYRLYNLTFLNSNGVFYKYVVSGFIVSTDIIRYYNIASIYREFNSQFDSINNDLDNEDNFVTEVASPIGKLFTVTTVDGVYSITCAEEKVVTIIDKHVGFIRYANSSNVWKRACDSHYVAFSTDVDIDYLYEVDISYVTRDYTYERRISDIDGTYTYGDYNPLTDTLKYTEKIEINVGLWLPTYRWNRIEEASSFVKNETSLSQNMQNKIKEKDWVLRFYESSFSRTETSVTGVFEKGTNVSDVTILRLKFKTEGIVYNLGVVDSKQTGSIIPDGEHNDTAAVNSFLDSLWKILLIAGLLIILIVLFPIIAPLIGYLVKGIFYILKYLALGLWYFVASPYYIYKYFCGN